MLFCSIAFAYTKLLDYITCSQLVIISVASQQEGSSDYYFRNHISLNNNSSVDLYNGGKKISRYALSDGNSIIFTFDKNKLVHEV